MKECDNSTRKIHISINFILSISLLKSLTPLCQSLFEPLFVHLSVTLLMELKCVWQPWCRDWAKVHGVTALQQLIRRIRSMQVPPEDRVNPSGGKVAKICERQGETALTPVLRVPAVLGFCSSLGSNRQFCILILQCTERAARQDAPTTTLLYSARRAVPLSRIPSTDCHSGQVAQTPRKRCINHQEYQPVKT